MVKVFCPHVLKKKKGFFREDEDKEGFLSVLPDLGQTTVVLIRENEIKRKNFNLFYVNEKHIKRIDFLASLLENDLNIFFFCFRYVQMDIGTQLGERHLNLS